MTAQELKKLAQQESSARLRTRYLAIYHFLSGKSRTEIADLILVSRTSVNKWVTAFLNMGLDGLQDKRHKGRASKLTIEQLNQISEYVSKRSTSTQGGRLQGRDVQQYIAEQFGIEYKKSQVYNILHKLNFSWISSRSRHPKQSEEAQETFKKIQNKYDP